MLTLTNPLFYQKKFLLRKFNTELFCTYNHERTYYHCRYNYISAYTKYQITTEFTTSRPKTYIYLTDDNNENKKSKGTKKCLIKIN